MPVSNKIIAAYDESDLFPTSGDIMKTHLLLLPLALTALLLSGCPDSKMPKAPPSTPEPKAAPTGSNTAGPGSTVASVGRLTHGRAA